MADDTDDRTGADRFTGRDEAKLPSLRDRAAAKAQTQDQDGEDRPMSAAQRQKAEEQKWFAEERERHAARVKEGEALMQQAENAEMKLWRVFPIDAAEPPFHFSNTPGVMLVAAPSAEYARRMAVQEADDAVWADEAKVGVEEYKATSPTVIVRDLREG